MANEGSTASHPSTGSEPGVHRLRDIVVEEVSLVDRAANRRRFLVIKRSNEMADPGKPKTRRASRRGPMDAAQRGRRESVADADNDVDKARSRMKPPMSEGEEDAEKLHRSHRNGRGEHDAAMDAREAKAINDAANADPDDEEDEEDEDREGEDDEDEDEDEGDEEDEEDDDQAAEKGVVERKKDDDDASDEDDKDESAENKDQHTARAAAGKRPSKIDGDVRATRRARNGKPAKKADDEELVLPPDVKNTVLRALAQVLERLMAVANQVRDADEPDDDHDAIMPDDLLGELEDVGELLESIGEQLADNAEKRIGKRPGAGKGRAAGTDNASADRAKRPAAKTDAPTPEPPKADVAKAGRRMAKERLDRFRKALELLSSLLHELTDATETPVPSAGSAERSVAKRDASPAMRELVASVQGLTRIVQRQEEQLVRLQKTRATSNAIPIEGASRRREIQEVSWPLDMNRPISRETVAKSVSFYDEE